jgi:hypothetical protein
MYMRRAFGDRSRRLNRKRAFASSLTSARDMNVSSSRLADSNPKLSRKAAKQPEVTA